MQIKPDTSKQARCAASRCPLAGKGDIRCAQCTGPIVWRDADTGLRTTSGRYAHRNCTDCPMNGLGLPVCWAGCDGPSLDFATDGQKMVTLGGMEDADSYISHNSSKRDLADVGATDEGEVLTRHVARRILSLDRMAWGAAQSALAKKDIAAAGRLSGIPKVAFLSDSGDWKDSPAGRIFAAMSGISPRNWETVRNLIFGRSKAAIARLTGGISRQSKHKEINGLAAKNEWVARLLKIIKKGCSNF